MFGKEFDVEIFVEFDGAQVHFEYVEALVVVGQFHVYLTVETASAEQGAVEYVGAVGGGQYDYALVCAKTVHLGEQLVEGVLALVVAAEAGVFATGATNGINLIDEYDAGRFFFGLAEEVAHPRCTHAHKHLHKVGPRHAKERYVGFACYSLGQQRFACPRRTNKQCAFGYFSAQIGVFFGVFEKIDNFHHLFLGTCKSSHVFEIDFLGGAFAVE